MHGTSASSQSTFESQREARSSFRPVVAPHTALWAGGELLTYEMLIEELGGSPRVTVERIAALYQEDVCAVREALTELGGLGLCGCEPARFPCKDIWTLLRASTEEAMDEAIRGGIELDRLVGAEPEILPRASTAVVSGRRPPSELFGIRRFACAGIARLCTIDPRICGGGLDGCPRRG